MPAPTIYYMRHGETDWNVEGRLQGGIDTPLNELGLAQAAHAGRVLADLLPAKAWTPQASLSSQARCSVRASPWILYAPS